MYLKGSGGAAAAGAGNGNVNNNPNVNRNYTPPPIVQTSVYDDYGTYIAIGAALIFLILIFKES